MSMRISCAHTAESVSISNVPFVHETTRQFILIPSDAIRDHISPARLICVKKFQFLFSRKDSTASPMGRGSLFFTVLFPAERNGLKLGIL